MSCHAARPPIADHHNRQPIEVFGMKLFR